MKAHVAKRLHELETENLQLKVLRAEAERDKRIPKVAAEGKFHGQLDDVRQSTERCETCGQLNAGH